MDDQQLRSLAHDLSSPLRAIRGFSTLFAQSWVQDESSANPEARALLSKIEKSGEQLDQRIKALSRYAQIAFLSKARPTDCDLAQMARSAVATAAAEVGGPPLSVHYGALPTVRGEPGWFELLFRELARNVYRHARSEEAQLRVEVEETASELILRWTDSGPGLDPELHERAFQLYWRLNPDSDAVGAGLTHARRAAELMGGTLRLHAAEPKGLTAELRLPA